MGLELAIFPSQPPAAGIHAVYSAFKLGLNLKKKMIEEVLGVA